MNTELWIVEPTNPGEVLACAGIAWLIERENSGVRTGFEPAGDGRWMFKAPFPGLAIETLLESEPAALESDGAVALGDVRLDWWHKGYGLNQPFKFWAGQQSARSVLTNLLTAARSGDPADWLQFQAPTTGRLGVDPLGSWNSLKLGWSPNEHQQIKYLCRPYVELLAFLALQRFAAQGSRERGFHYSLWKPVTLHVATLAFARVSIHQLGGWTAAVAGSGSNKILNAANPIGE